LVLALALDQSAVSEPEQERQQALVPGEKGYLKSVVVELERVSVLVLV